MFETKNLQKEYVAKFFEYTKFVITELLLPPLFEKCFLL